MGWLIGYLIGVVFSFWFFRRRPEGRLAWWTSYFVALLWPLVWAYILIGTVQYARAGLRKDRTS